MLRYTETIDVSDTVRHLPVAVQPHKRYLVNVRTYGSITIQDIVLESDQFQIAVPCWEEWKRKP